MSVINNVLKDLETRASNFAPIDIPTLEQRLVPNRVLKPLLLVALVLLVLAAGWIYLQNQAPFKPTPSLSDGTVEAVPQPVEPVISQVAEPAPIVANQIIGLQIRESTDEMRLEFALRDKVVSYLKERGENLFGYHLRNIESQIVAPVIHDNRWLEQFSIDSTDNGVDVIFETAANVLVETRQSHKDGEQIWAINLKKSKPRVVSEALVPSENVAETPTPSAIQQRASAVEAESPQTLKQEPAVVKLDIQSTNPNAKAINQLEYAVDLINSRRLADAENLLLGLLGGVQDYTARKHLLVLYSRQNRNDRFSRLVRESITRYPDEAIFKTEYARSLYQITAYRAVIDLFGAQTNLNADQQALAAASYQRLDQHENAIEYYQLALAQDANNAKNWIGLGISQEHSSAFEDALHSYQMAAKLGKLNDRLQAFVEKRSDTLKQVLN